MSSKSLFSWQYSSYSLVLVWWWFFYLEKVSTRDDVSKKSPSTGSHTPRKDSDADAKQDNSKDFQRLYRSHGAAISCHELTLLWQNHQQALRTAHFSLEYIAYHNQIYFHLVVPMKYQSLVEKQVTSFFSDAVIEEVEELNLFEWENLHYATECLTLGHNYIFPIKTHQNSNLILSIISPMPFLSSTKMSLVWFKWCFVQQIITGKTCE